MAVKWTDAQENAISARERNVLVCAAAGSGKTATLTERIIRRLTDRDSPADISRMLVVTFTRNAAAELREKIYRALSDALEADPKNKFLAMQMTKLPSARISTIHSFCFDIVKRNAAALGLSSSVKNESASEGELRARRVMDEVVADFYDSEKDGESSAEFARLAESIADAKSEGTLADIFLSLYKALCSYSGGAGKLKECAYKYVSTWKSEFFDSAYGKVYKEELYSKMSAYRDKYDRAIRTLASEDAEHPYLSALQSDRILIEQLLLYAEDGYSEIAWLWEDVEFEALGRMKKEAATVSSENAKMLRGDFKADIRKLAELFEYSEDELEYASIETAVLSMTLADVLCEFEERFRADKKEAGVLDYNDLEYYAERVLYDGDAPSDAAREIAALTDEIYIDEYQDVNEVQDRIFAAVSNGHNLFMVGDVKQSIYGFRGGDPSIFTSRRDGYKHYVRGEASHEPCSIFMQNNFRCDSRVVDFVNRIFAVLLGEGYGKFKYIPEDELVYSKDGGTVSEHEVYPRVVICEQDEQNTSKSFSAQAAFVADEIVRLINGECKNDGTQIKPEDIAILLRSDRSAAPIYKRELERRGVPVSTGDKEPFYNSAEVKLALCLLNAVDNPHRDVYLAGALLSGIYGFSVDELAKIRTSFRDTLSLYESVVLYAEKYDDPKCKAFIEANDRYREIAKTVSSDALIWQIYEENSFICLAAAMSRNVYERRRVKKNCMALYDCARSFEQGSFRGLYSFLEYMESMTEQNLSEGSEKEFAEGCVRIMSMHASKGLEFPVCFVCETQKNFNREDTQHRLLYDRDIGLGFKLRSDESLAVTDTPHRRAVGMYKSRLAVEEEMRILYVALTRARERLYVTAKPPHASTAEKMRERAEFRSEFFSENTVSELSNFADAILLCMERTPMPVPLEVVHMSDKAEPRMLALSATDGEGQSVPASAEQTAEICSVLRERMEYEYPHEALTRIKAKMSVSKLYPGVLDEDGEEETADISLDQEPRFMCKENEPSGAERGVATHLIMQFADFEKMKNDGVETELSRLVSDGFIDSHTAQLANREHIEAFLHSDFFARIAGADKLWREFRFNLYLDASCFTENAELKEELSGEQLLVQGVIDGFFLEGDNIILFDYKTDFLTDYELSHPQAAAAKLSERHSEQLGYYKSALERIFGRNVSDVYIYSLPLGRELRINLKDDIASEK